jgi:hypothetical protein
MADDDGSWHLDKKVPISLIGAILVQTFGFGVYAESLNNRVATLEQNAPSEHAEFEKLEQARESMVRALDALTFQTQSLDKTLQGQDKRFGDLANSMERVETVVRAQKN